MADEYTPTTKAIRRALLRHGWFLEEEIERWLAAHDGRAVAALHALMDNPSGYSGNARDLIGDLQDAAHSLHDYTAAQITELLLAAARVLDETEGTVNPHG